MDNSKINQTELSYKCGAGESKVNLYTGRMVFNAVDANVGTDSYELILYHIYNSHLGLPVGVNTKVGSKWKLNLQEYIYKVGTDYYIDASGMKINFRHLYDNTYYDTSGLGMQLRLLTDQIEIIDMANNKKIFRNNRLEEIISGENSSIIKELIYTNNKLTLIKDTRKPDTNIKLEYNNDLLSNIIVTVKNKEQLRLKYYYKENQLVMISKIVDGFEKVSTLFRYTGDNLTYAVCYQNKSALKFTYNSVNKVIRVDTGVAKIKSTKISSNNVFLGESIYCGEKDYVGDTTYINNYVIEECITEYGRDLLTYNIITYNESNSVVKNEKGLKNVYYFNENGFMVSILESVNTSNTNLKTLKKMPGKSMLNENGGDDSEIINTQNAFNLTTISEISTSTIMSVEKNH